MPWRASVAAQLSERFCEVVHKHGGQAPQRCRAFVNEEIVTLVVEDTLNSTERSVHDSDAEAVARSRRAIQRMVRVSFTPELEALLESVVLTSTSGHAVNPDIGIYNFVLASRPVQDPQREQAPG